MSNAGPGLVVYGGAFDPPHVGHLACAQLVMQAFPEARLKVVPGLRPAVAGGAAKEPSASFNDRVAMCRLAFPGVEIDPIESNLPTPNYTYRTLGALAVAEPNLRMGLLVGSDQLHSFAAWQYPQKILELADLIIVTRPGVDTALALPNSLHGTLRCIGSTNSSASSQLIRSYLARGEALPSAWLPEAVAKYIAGHALYKKEYT